MMPSTKYCRGFGGVSSSRLDIRSCVAVLLQKWRRYSFAEGQEAAPIDIPPPLILIVCRTPAVEILLQCNAASCLADDSIIDAD